MRASRKRTAGALALSAVLLGLAVPARAGEWNIRNIDTSGVVRYSSLQFDQNGNGHIGYVVEDQQHSLKYAFWDHLLQRWFTMAVAPDALFCSLALDSKQRPQIAYVDQSGSIRYTHWDGAVWQKNVIPFSNGVASYTSIALDGNDYPQISFVERQGPGRTVPHLRSLAWNGKFWVVRTVDSDAVSLLNAFERDSAGGIHAAYAAAAHGRSNLRYAYSNGDEWKTEVADPAVVQIMSLGMAVDQKHEPHVAYIDGASRAVKYAVREGGRWRVEIATWVTDALFPDRDGIAVDEQGNPYISFYDAGQKALKVAYVEDNKWTSETVDTDASGYNSSIQLNGDTLWVAYAGERDGTLKVASKKLRETESARQAVDPRAGKP